jgi:hypothetical protein
VAGTGSRTALLLALTASTVALALGGCGGGGDGGSGTTNDAGAAARAARHIPPGVTITHTETGPARAAGQGMPPLRTAAAARAECASLHAGYIAKIYGGISDDDDSIAYWFAKRRAAPGDRAVVRRGCRAGLHV